MVIKTAYNALDKDIYQNVYNIQILGILQSSPNLINTKRIGINFVQILKETEFLEKVLLKTKQ